jgi:heme o synthase
MSSIVENEEGVRATAMTQRWMAYFELTKPRISTMVLITIIVAAIISSRGQTNFATVLNVLVGMFLVAASGNAMNMYLERYSDLLMRRTAKRPLPDQRLTSVNVLNFAAITAGAGLAYLLLLTNWQTAVCALATWLLYSFVYTPLKSLTPLNTEVGAIAGAMPVACGSLAATQSMEPFGIGLFTMLLFWQFPHFMAIAWLYREQYREGGLKMLSVTEPTGRAAGRKAIVMSIATWLASTIPLLAISGPVAKIVFVLITTVLAAIYFSSSWRFAKLRDEYSARKLLRISIIYLPLYMIVLLIFSRM